MLVSNDMDAHIISGMEQDGSYKGHFGLVISLPPDMKDGMKLWHAYTALTDIDGFWEL